MSVDTRESFCQQCNTLIMYHGLLNYEIIHDRVTLCFWCARDFISHDYTGDKCSSYHVIPTKQLGKSYFICIFLKDKILLSENVQLFSAHECTMGCQANANYLINQIGCCKLCSSDTKWKLLVVGFKAA